MGDPFGRPNHYPGMHRETNNVRIEERTVIKEVHHHHYHENSASEDSEATIELTGDEEDEAEAEGETNEEDRGGAFAEGGLVILENPADQEAVDDAENM